MASIYQPLKMLADGLDAFFDRGAWIDAANEWTALQTLARTGDENPDLEFTAAITTRKLALRFTLGTKYARLYRLSSTATLELTINAVWRTASADWARDAAGDALKIAFNDDSVYLYTRPSASASPWADGSWTNWAILGDAGISSAAGFIASAGDITADAGNLEGRHLLGNSTAPTAVAGAAAGAGPPAVTVAGSDLGGTISLTAGAGAGAGLVMTMTMGANFSAAFYPIVVAADAGAAGVSVYVSAPTVGPPSTWQLWVIGAGLVNGTTYTWSYKTTG